MASLFSRTRCVELSIIDAIETAVNASWTGVTTVKAFAQAYAVKVPVICVRMLSVASSRLEIGGNTLYQEFSFIIDVFAKSDGQRIDLSDFLVNTIKNGCIYYTYTRESGTDNLTKSANGRIQFLRIDTDNRIDSGESEDEHERYRQSITFTVTK